MWIPLLKRIWLKYSIPSVVATVKQILLRQVQVGFGYKILHPLHGEATMLLQYFGDASLVKGCGCEGGARAAVILVLGLCHIPC